MSSADKIYGLILSGGKSTRMGKDKGKLEYHGKPHREYLYELLDKFCDRTFLSIREDQVATISSAFETITDQDIFRGPFNGILSAHEIYPDVAWLVLACDLPLVDEEAIRQLIESRAKEKFATSFAVSGSDLPEPMCTLWEVGGLQAAGDYLNEGNGSCPRKFLIKNEIKLIHPKDDRVLMNANSLEDYNAALENIN
ncbi:molybdenum cofactor guanylyltransferase [Robertkochia solimangrovi]|uniref:molybdenum cofactor guanylyltransferase n=1 Tax=Robertkochia solimangrovi TaxID=2213046 RepID=UPI0011810DC6|nr:molybdenum cofactor guanylyltransferase [Robertkochia solimangrovi]TRZ43271.1 molybdenum cofactor guanylyltransferase [Robertkochia solimangrovi]